MKLTTLGLQVPERRSAPTHSYVPFGGAASWEFFGGGRSSDAGEIVSEHTAISIAAVYACVRVLQESVASLPLRIYRKTSTGRIEAVDEPLHYLLTVEPNVEMSAAVMVESLVRSMLLTGSAYAEVERTPLGDVVGLWPLDPRLTQPIREPDGTLAFKTTEGGEYRILDAQDVLHFVMMPSADGLVGLSPIQAAMNTFGSAIACDRFSARFYRNQSTPSLALTTDKEVKPEDKAKMRDEWEALHSGSNQHRVAILDQGMAAERLSISPEEAQFIETRKLLKEDIASLFRVPLLLLSSSERLSQASAEQFNLSFVTDTLRPLANRFCQEIARKLLRPKPGRPVEFVVEADFSERLRGDVAASTNYYKTGIQFGWLCPNDVRRELHLNEGPESLNVFQTPVNMMNSERLLDTSSPLPTVSSPAEN